MRRGCGGSGAERMGTKEEGDGVRDGDGDGEVRALGGKGGSGEEGAGRGGCLL